MGTRKAAIHNLFRTNTTEWVEGARVIAKGLLRTNPTVSMDDIRAVYPLPGYLNRNTPCAVFNSPEFIPAGFTRSNRHGANGHIIRTWKLR